MNEDKRRPGGAQGSGFSLDAALRGAARLSPAPHLVEATRLLRRALSGRETSSPLDVLPRSMPPLVTDDPQVVLTARELASAEPAPRSAYPRMRQPLGTVLDLLARQEARGPGHGVVAPAILRESEPRVPAGAIRVTRSYSSTAGARDYRLYVPSVAASGVRGLVVMLHGCTQTPDDFAAGTGMNALAEEHGFVVAYPWQSNRANQSGCWNWFSPEDQVRDRGEPSIIAGLTRVLVNEFDIEETSVFVAGLSAGGAMAAILAATYPDIYHAAGIHSGLACGAASDVMSAFAAMRGAPLLTVPGKKKSAISISPVHTRTIVFHGSADQTVHPSNGEEIFQSARQRLNSGAETKQQGRSSGGLSYTRKIVSDSWGRPQLEHWTIDGLGHAWSGGRPDGSFTDLAGPDASREMVRFFLARDAAAASTN